MKEKIKNLNIKYCFMSFAIVILTQSCVSMVKHEKMELISSQDEPVILKLKNYGDFDETLFIQSENLTKKHLFKDDGEEYGYYVLNYKTTQAKGAFGVISGFFFYLIPYGLPTSIAGITLQAKLYIFDSKGFLVKEYEDDDFFIQTAGLYYGHNPTKKATKKYSKMYDDIFELAKLQAEKINKKLLETGPITKENEKDAKDNIKAFFEARNESYTKIVKFNKRPEFDDAVNTLYSTDLLSSCYGASEIETRHRASSTTDFDFTKLNGGLEAGTYYCTVNKSLQMKIVLGIVSLVKGDEAIAAATYKVSGNKLIVSFYAGVGYQGKTYTYTIEDSKNFYLDGSNEYWIHESIY